MNRRHPDIEECGMTKHYVTEHDGGPAFPQDLDGRRGDNPEMQGMALRDWFAGLAMQALIHEAFCYWRDNEHDAALTPHAVKTIADVSTTAYAQANAMLKEREQS